MKRAECLYFMYVSNKGWCDNHRHLVYWSYAVCTFTLFKDPAHWMWGACADPGISSGGVQVSLTKKKKLWKRFFWSSAYSTEVKWLISKKSIIFQGSRGNPTYSRGIQLFPGGGGVQLLIPKETHITCDFPGGGGSGPAAPPPPPSGSALEVRPYSTPNYFTFNSQ